MFFIIKLNHAEYFKGLYYISVNINYVKLLVKKFKINLRIKLEQNNKVRQYSREYLQEIQRVVTTEWFQLIIIQKHPLLVNHLQSKSSHG
jgi:hypothetical protein